MKYPIYQVDAFAVKPFKGNPAAVVMLEESHPGSWMQSVAQEVNLSETAFLRPKGHDYELRWFTPRLKSIYAGMPPSPAPTFFMNLAFTT